MTYLQSTKPAQPEVRRLYESGTGRAIAYVALDDDVYCIEGDRWGYDLTVSYQKAYEHKWTDVTDMVTGRYGVTNPAIEREVREGMVTRAVQLGMVA